MMATNVEDSYTFKWAERSINKLIHRSKLQVNFDSDTTKSEKNVYSILQTYPLPTDLV